MNLHFTLAIEVKDSSAGLHGNRIAELTLPGESLIVIIKHNSEVMIPHRKTILQKGDRLSIIEQANDIKPGKSIFLTVPIFINHRNTCLTRLNHI